MNTPSLVSVIIPTYNRRDVLARTLDSLRQQSLPPQSFEVVVVDDGSTDGTGGIADQTFPFTFRYVRQPNQGASAARNHGAETSRGDILVFLDDDISLCFRALGILEQVVTQHARTIILGTLLVPGVPAGPSKLSHIEALLTSDERPDTEDKYVHFTGCMTGLLAVRRKDFFELGRFQDPTGGWPNWDDVDFGYRAHRAGYRLLRSHQAQAIHYDSSTATLQRTTVRWYNASRSAARLFQRYPELRPELPMFRDKGPVAWSEDPPALIARKLGRQLGSSRPALGVMQTSAGFLEGWNGSAALLRPLYRWIIGGYIFRGYRDGCREVRLQSEAH